MANSGPGRAQGHGHGGIQKITKEEDDLDDPVERMLKSQGCLEKHYDVQRCIAETKDWRKCQHVVEAFRLCIEAAKKKSGEGR
jgi:cytochrome c oxidase assembly factor 4